MAIDSVFGAAKAKPWKNPIGWIVVALLIALAIWYFWPLNGTEKPVEEVIIDPQVVTIQMLNEKVTTLEKSNGEIKASLDTAIAGINLLREEMKECCECKKPSVKKVVRKKPKQSVKAPRPVSQPAPVPQYVPAPLQVVPKYVPPVYNKPTIKNPETGKVVPTMPLGVQPVMTCNNQPGGVPCAK